MMTDIFLEHIQKDMKDVRTVYIERTIPWRIYIHEQVKIFLKLRKALIFNNIYSTALCLADNDRAIVLDVKPGERRHDY